MSSLSSPTTAMLRYRSTTRFGATALALFLVLFFLSPSLPFLPATRNVSDHDKISLFDPTCAIQSEDNRLIRNLTRHEHPTEKFRENLWPDKKYVTSWGGAGFTNDFQSYMITIYLGMITDRIPVLPAISRSHHVFPTNDIWLGDIFDLGELAEKIRHPILEWPSVKKIDSLQVETLGCWSHWLLLGDSQTRNTNVPNDLRLDLSYTSVPEWAKLEQSSHILQIWSLATLGFHEGHSRGVSGNQPLASPLNGAIEPPDQHLLCLDSLYFTGFVYNIDSFDSGHAPVWRAVAQYARFLPSVNRLAKTYIRRAFGLAETDEIPQFIAIHIRRSDFADWCRPPDIIEDCLPQLDAFVLRVKEVEAELQSRDKGIQLPMRVLVTSDEPYTVDRAGHDGVVTKVANPYWQKISDLGWNYVNHDAEQTVVKHGAYLPLIIDQAVHSLAIGFVGTDLSTMSRMGALRVETWNGGITRKVMWGNKKADIH